ncbi:hypothetical protein AB6A40_008054 [Gnathostoma spinigerum]|uniref:Ig-like domain-containing protein n=1 Tax=Gnathostoma spinigerum TaxID=75299 RepID=A0ABD6EYL6_9BILA
MIFNCFCLLLQFTPQVAWTRVNDEALLTAGDKTFTSDGRFQISFKPAESDWILIIRRTERFDTGCYLCEVNTEPKSTVYPVYLNVLDYPISELTTPTNIRPRQLKTKTKLMANMIGNEILLNCTFTLTNEAVSNDSMRIHWSKDGRPLDFSLSNKYVLTTTTEGQKVIHTLRIMSASSDDDGNYACGSADAPQSFHMLHVNSDAHPSEKYFAMRVYLVVSIFISVYF